MVLGIFFGCLLWYLIDIEVADIKNAYIGGVYIRSTSAWGACIRGTCIVDAFVKSACYVHGINIKNTNTERVCI